MNPGNWFGTYSNPLVKSQLGSGASEGKNDYEDPCAVRTATGSILGDSVAPGTLATYRIMSSHPTIAIAEAAIALAVLAAKWSVEMDEELVGDPDAERIKRIIKLELIDPREILMCGVVQALRYGFKSQEIVYARKSDAMSGEAYVGIKKFKQLAGENITLNVDQHGNLQQVLAMGTPLEAPYFLHVVYGKEDDNWFGRSRHENCRRFWANWLHLEDNTMRLARRGTGSTVHVGVPPDTDVDKKAGRTPNLDAGKLAANKLSDGQSIVYENLVGLSAQDAVNNAELAGKSLIGIGTIDIGNPGPTMAGLNQRQEYLDKLLVRGWLQPERSLTEATTAGSRADSESHGLLAVTDAETTHELFVEQINEQVARALVIENVGPRYADRVRLIAVPLQDKQRTALADLFNSLLTDPAIRSELAQAMGNEGMRGLIERIGLKVKLERNFDFEPSKKSDDRDYRTDDEAVEKELSAIIELAYNPSQPRDENGRWIKVQSRMFDGDPRKARKWAMENVRGTYTNEETGWEIRVAANGIGKVTSQKAYTKSGTPDHLETLQQLPEVIRTMKKDYSRSDRQQSPSILAMHFFKSKLLVDGKAYDVGITVKELAQVDQGKSYYTHELVEIKMPGG